MPWYIIAILISVSDVNIKAIAVLPLYIHTYTKNKLETNLHMCSICKVKRKNSRTKMRYFLKLEYLTKHL